MIQFKSYAGSLVGHPETAGLSWALDGGQWTRTLDREDDEHLLLYEHNLPIGILKYRPPFGDRCHLLYILVETAGV